jgi:steroid 5-alpha reductase family enzyme
MKGSLVLPAVLALAFCMGVGLLTWVCSRLRKDASLADRAWPLSVGGAGLLQILVFPGTASTRAMAMGLLGMVWAVRLGIFITVRNWGHGEDRRYRDMRLRHAPDFDWKSLYLVFGLQAVLAWFVAAPFLAGTMGGRALGLADAAGATLAGFGIAFEAVGDAQLARFKANPAHRGQVMDGGLWRFTRHPNYFGEACVWWGLWLMAVSGGGWAGTWSMVSPLLMTVLLLKVSGVGLLEKDIAERRPAYRAYIARTNAFVPGPRRRTTS